MSRLRSAAPLAAVGVLLLGVAACSGGESTRPQVASLSSRPATVPDPTRIGAAVSSVPSSGGAAHSETDRTLPLGATRAEFDRLYEGWQDCLRAKGVPAIATRGGTAVLPNGKKITMTITAQIKSELASCAYLEPREPPELDPRTNPDYWDQLRVQAQCVRAKGYDVSVQKSDGTGLSLGKSAMARMGSPAFERAFGSCEVKAFSH